MKKTKFLVLAALAAMFVGCQSEEPEQISGNDRPGPTGDTRIIIEGEGMLDTQSRSSDGRVDFTGGYATGAGLYDGSKHIPVEAHPNAGYEVSYFYGGPASEPKKYDYAQSGASAFDVDLGGQDHTFHCGFKEKKRTLTVNAGSGGKVSPSGTKEYQVEKPISITATPNSGYEFSGWSITGGDVTIANPNSSSTTATLHNSNSTITAKFNAKITEKEFTFFVEIKGLANNISGRVDIKRDGKFIAYVDNNSPFIELKVKYNQSTIIEFFADKPTESWEIDGREVNKGDYLSIFPFECTDGTHIVANFVAW